ncbi:hypothetical protein LOCC1_G006300 [Lachnellula occidentalis]|uniref:Uncharacterized protein n=1 Tax=Lachnellula occidentalis TaxID=215460 RepID=A0A8H8UBM4_9HELO|nr:hypothetical protein LOCC1_G006300 [Lachnellula occidentalis]
MVHQHTLLHIIELLAAVVCAHHFWPKGITYGEQEDWEKHLHQKAHHAKSRAKARGKSKAKAASASSRGDGRGRVRRRDRDREARYYDDGVRERRGYGDRKYDYEDRPPRYSKGPDRGGSRSVY